MRTVRFRLWDKKHESFVNEPYHAISLLGTIQVEGHASVEPNRYVIQQFTGMQDRHGKDIYDGDIVQISEYSDSIMNAVVTWGYFDDCCVEGETWLVFPGKYQPTLYHYLDCVEVIGNKFEHPELLPSTDEVQS